MTPERNSGFLTRLAQDTAGTTMAMMAVAVIPLIGLVGGGVDASRVYIVQTRMQQACDSGALAGRKAMGSGDWTTTTGGTRDQAQEMFSANFKDGDFGATLNTVGGTFTEDDGTVSGAANADVPMTLLKVFGQPTKNVAVTCTAKMEIPNTDVMFVLDLTASMNCAPGAAATCYGFTPVTNAKITGLKKAVKCFYEALLKVGTTEPCTAVVSGGTTSYNSTNDPTGTSYTGTAQIRLGFVPYGVNVNVGRLLPHTYVANTVPYQTRQATLAPAWSWVAGATTTPSWGNWVSGEPANWTSQGSWSTWTDLSNSPTTIVINGATRTKRPTGYTSTTCPQLNTLGPSGNKMFDIQENTPANGAETPGTATPAAPVYGTHTQQTVPYSQNRTHTGTGYKYVWNTSSGGSCRLQYASSTRTYTSTRSGSATKPLTWTEHPLKFDNWSYAQASLDVSALKTGTNTYAGSVMLPLASTSRSVALSGASAASTIYERADTAVTWDGCIEEATTFQNTDGTLSDDWSGDDLPAGAFDMDIDLLPDTEAKRWKPMLPDAFWGRYTGTDRTTGKTLNTVTVAAGSTQLNRNLAEGGVSTGYYCPIAARKLGPYNTASDFESYINSLVGLSIGTYHDIGMLWGARLLSPTGIFGDENDYTDNGGAIERHLIFMTDGDASTFTNNLSAYGSPWWDRRQMNTAPTTSKLDNAVEARLTRLCSDIKARNIELWVISYGGAVDAANETRLTNCASPNRFYSAADTPTLINNFRQIASEIADLRLTT